MAFGPSCRCTRVWRPGRGDFQAWVVKLPFATSAALCRDSDTARPGWGDPCIAVSNHVMRSLRGLVQYIFSDVESDWPVPTSDISRRPCGGIAKRAYPAIGGEP